MPGELSGGGLTSTDLAVWSDLVELTRGLAHHDVDRHRLQGTDYLTDGGMFYRMDLRASPLGPLGPLDYDIVVVMPNDLLAYLRTFATDHDILVAVEELNRDKMAADWPKTPKTAAEREAFWRDIGRPEGTA